MSQYWTALAILKQVAGELGLPRPPSITGIEDTQSVQLLSLLNSGGNELLLYYPWEQFIAEWAFVLEADKGSYDTPSDMAYLTNQTQWDRTNHWPLLGPKSPQEWAWLKGALVAALPRIRYRIMGNKFTVWPVPTAQPNSGTGNHLAMEYISENWVLAALAGPLDVNAPAGTVDMVTQDADLVCYDPWLMIKFIKFKFYELKGFATTGVQADFMRVFNSLTGKDTGGKVLSLAPIITEPYLSARNVPDGSWNVYG